MQRFESGGMMENGITLNTQQFQEALREYRQYSKRDIPTIINTKAFYIARAAVFHTPRADKGKVSDDLDKLFGSHLTKVIRGIMVQRHNDDSSAQVPLAALLINAERGKRGLPGLYGRKMFEAIGRLKANKFRSIAFLKSGWIPAIKMFERLAKDKSGAKPNDASVKIRDPSKPYGRAKAASENDSIPEAILENFAHVEGKKAGAFTYIVTKGLSDAIQDEIYSIRDYISKKVQERADQFAGRN